MSFNNSTPSRIKAWAKSIGAEKLLCRPESEAQCYGCGRRPEVHGSCWCGRCHETLPERTKRRVVDLHERIRDLEAPMLEVLKRAEREEGVNSTALANALCRRIENQRREISKLRAQVERYKGLAQTRPPSSELDQPLEQGDYGSVE